MYSGMVGVAEGLVARELRFRGRHELVALLHVVHVVDGEAAALFEKRAHDLAIHGEAVRLHRLAQELGFERVVSAERGIAAAHDEVGRRGLVRDLRDALANLPVRGARLIARHAAAVGEDVEQLVFLGKARANALQAPICVHRHVVDGLHTGWIVVEHDDLAGVLRNLLREERVDRLLVDRGIRVQDVCGKSHESFLRDGGVPTLRLVICGW